MNHHPGCLSRPANEMFVDLGEARMTLRSLPAEQAALDLPEIEVQHTVSPSLLILSVSSTEGEDN